MVDGGMEQTLVGSPWQERRVSQAQQPEELTARCPLLEEGGLLSAMGQGSLDLRPLPSLIICPLSPWYTLLNLTSWMEHETPKVWFRPYIP